MKIERRGFLTRMLEVRLRAMIHRDRDQGLEVRYFHMNRATMEKLREEVGTFFNHGPLAFGGVLTFEGVRWWGDERMTDGEILLSAEPVCPRCYGEGVIPVEGSAGDMSRVMGHAESGMIPEPVEVYMNRPCPFCAGVGRVNPVE